MKSVAAQNTFKFLIGALLGLGLGLGVFDLIRERPVLLGTVWLLVVVGSGLLGIRVFNAAGKFPLSKREEEDRWRPSKEVVMVVGYVLLGALLWALL